MCVTLMLKVRFLTLQREWQKQIANDDGDLAFGGMEKLLQSTARQGVYKTGLSSADPILGPEAVMRERMK